jgi:predicted DNA-binding transcriptional regulator YafY
MSRTPRKNEVLGKRLGDILWRLNQGEALSAEGLASDLGVDVRTIQRDLNERLSALPIEYVDKLWRLQSNALGKLTVRDLTRFAEKLGAAGLLPSLRDEYLRSLIAESGRGSWQVTGHHREDISGLGKDFADLEAAILNAWALNFAYRKVNQSESKDYRGVEPYKLRNEKGIWYLVGKHEQRLKSFCFTGLSRLQVLQGQTFEPDAQLREQAEGQDGIWFGASAQTVVLAVSAEAAPYFKRRRLVDEQVIEAEHPDGSIMVRTRAVHADQILPIVRYWIPHIRVVEPPAMQQALEAALLSYCSSR